VVERRFWNDAFPMRRAPIVRSHHEKWDDRFPRWLKDEAIPIGARILAAVDSWTHDFDRQYAKRFPREALRMMIADSGRL